MTIVVFCASSSHYQRLDPLVERLGRRGFPVVVYSVSTVRPAVEASGARLVELFERFPVDAADATSRPRACRLVSHAAHFAEAIIALVNQQSPSLIIYDTYAVIGLLVGRILRIPHVNVCAGHNWTGSASDLRRLDEAWGTHVAAECNGAVRRLREDYGMLDAHPFWFLNARSPHLNVYCEPCEFLRSEERRIFEPIEFFGSLPHSIPKPGSAAASPFGRTPDRDLKIYVSFGRVVWEIFPDLAVAVARAMARALAGFDRIATVISLGGWSDGDATSIASNPRENVMIRDHVDQWSALEHADLFITHNGLKSTHESIYQRVPMLSYPLFGDQPQLAKRCAELGVAIPLTATPRREIRTTDVQRALARFQAKRNTLASKLENAAAWERRAFEARGGVIDRIVSLARQAPPSSS